MSGTLFNLPRYIPVSSTGRPYPLSTLTFYQAGTTTLATVYTTAALSVAHSNPLTSNSAGLFPAVYFSGSLGYNYKAVLKTSSGVTLWTEDNIPSGALSAADIGSALYPRSAGEIAEAVTPSNYSYPVGHAKRYGAVGDGSTADQTAMQNWLNCAHASGVEAYLPAGNYLVTGLTIPGNDGSSSTTDERGQGLVIRGAGYGEPFVTTYNTAATWISSVTDAPVLQDISGDITKSNGTVEISGIRFAGASDNYPVVLLQSAYGQSSFHNNCVYQAGNGDGLKITAAGATIHVYECYAYNADFVTLSLGAARTGVGYYFLPAGNGGLTTFRKCTSRGFEDGFIIGGGVGIAYSPSIQDCEMSTTYNGITLAAGTNNAVVSGCYMEGGDGGTGVIDAADYTTVRDTLIFAGFAVGISATATGTVGGLYTGNTIAMGDKVNAIGIALFSDDYHKSAISNTIAYTAGTAGVAGIKVTGVNPTLTIQGNAFLPSATWTGSGSYKILDSSTGTGLQGLTTIEIGSQEAPKVAQGAISLAKTAITETAVSANVLTLGAGNYYVLTAGAPVTVTSFTPLEDGRLYILRTPNTNTTINDGAGIALAGGSAYNLNGVIGFISDGSAVYELFRANLA